MRHRCERSVLGAGAQIKDKHRCERSVLGAGAQIKDEAQILEERTGEVERGTYIYSTGVGTGRRL